METKEIIFWVVSFAVLIALLLWPTVKLPKGKWIYTIQEMEDKASGINEQGNRDKNYKKSKPIR
jgi:hypothetical protein